MKNEIPVSSNPQTAQKQTKYHEQEPTTLTIKSGNIVYDQIYAVQFSASRVTYKGLLVMKDGVGKMRLKFGDIIIEQKMNWLSLAGGGGVYQGYDPIDVSTNRRLVDYRADNFHIINGECWNLDDAGKKAQVTTQQLSTLDSANEWLRYLEW